MSSEKKQIVFVESSPVDMCGKMARVLRKRGYECVLISLTGKDGKNFARDSFDKRIYLDSKFFKVNLRNLPKIAGYGLKKSRDLVSAYSEIRKLKPYIVIGRANPNWLCYLAMKYFGKSRFVYFPYDIRSFCYNSMKEAKGSGVPRFEILAERACFENCAGIIHKGSEGELELLDEKVFGRKIKINVPVIHFLPYCLQDLISPINKNKLSNKDKGIHLVHAGSVAQTDQWMLPLREILNQGIHVHLYMKTANLSKKEVYDKIKKENKYKDITEHENMHFHDPLEQKELAKEISKYDFGLWYGSEGQKRKNIVLATGNKIASYFEAGLPLIYFDNYTYLDELMEKYGTGIKVSTYDKLKKVLKKANYKKLLKNVEKARKDYLMEKHIERLEKFFEEVRKI